MAIHLTASLGWELLQVCEALGRSLGSALRCPLPPLKGNKAAFCPGLHASGENPLLL